MRIVIDSREQTPLDFSKYDCTVEIGSLTTGDYSLHGLEHLIALERKSLPDLVSSLSSGRDRFEREIQRGTGMEFFAVIIEGSMEDVRAHNYRSQMKPHAVLQSVLTFQIRYGIPFIWAGTPKGAAYVVYWTLQKFLREAEVRLKAIAAHANQISETTVSPD